jgi:hypothetical protein
MIVDALWYVSNATLHADLGISYVQDVNCLFRIFLDLFNILVYRDGEPPDACRLEPSARYKETTTGYREQMAFSAED